MSNNVVIKTNIQVCLMEFVQIISAKWEKNIIKIKVKKKLY